jgi:serine/threonine-protein kinase
MVHRFGPMAPARVAFVLRQICHSLSEAHARGVVHRDIKPANVFLCRYGEDCDFVKVLDFGLAKSLGDREDAEPALTRADAVQGTPAFIAPEQVLGRAVDARTDIYATGCVAYWLLTGRLVFTGAAMELLVHHAHSEPAPPSAGSETPIPEALDRLVLACLAKDPAQRPQSAGELAAALDTVFADGAEWNQDAARDWWRSHDLDLTTL